ncbi:hypothetical protein EON82_07255 [bacterium]|nr:MAG: hypothetical protein EON82_07255 [bacterium]
MPPNDVGEKAELARLKAKIATVQDRDIRAALQARIDELSAKVAAEPEVEEVAEPEELPPPPTPEQAEQAERLVRQAVLEKRRGNKEAVTKLLQEAVAVAPGAPATLEALGDDFAERRRTKEALEYYRRAKELDPKNVGLERKHAELALRVGMAGSIEDQMRANLSDSWFIGQGDNTASLGTARLLSFIAPGLGHLVLGRTAAGFGLLGTWIACMVWLLIQHNDVAGLVKMILGGRGNFGGGIFPPLLIAIITLFMAVGSLSGGRSAARKAKPKAHPKPPVDLPFE